MYCYFSMQAPAAFGLVSFLMHAGLERNRIRKHLLVFALAAPVLSMLTYLGLSKVNELIYLNVYIDSCGRWLYSVCQAVISYNCFILFFDLIFYFCSSPTEQQRGPVRGQCHWCCNAFLRWDIPLCSHSPRTSRSRWNGTQPQTRLRCCC